MVELSCRDCRANREIPAGLAVTEELVYFDVRSNGDVAYVGTINEQITAEPSYRPQQRYVCPECGYAWTDRPSDKWERLAQSGAGVALIVSVGLGALALGWGFWAFAIAVALAGGVVHTTEQVRSAVEDWLDPADTTYRTV